MNLLGKIKSRFSGSQDSKHFLTLAEQYRSKDMLEEAVEVLQDGISKYPNYTSANVALGKVFIELGLLEDAIEQFEKVIKIAPDNLLALKKLATLYSSVEERGKSINACRRILDINPLDETTAFVLNNLESEEALAEEADDEFVELEKELNEAASISLPVYSDSLSVQKVPERDDANVDAVPPPNQLSDEAEEYEADVDTAEDVPSELQSNNLLEESLVLEPEIAGAIESELDAMFNEAEAEADDDSVQDQDIELNEPAEQREGVHFLSDLDMAHKRVERIKKAVSSISDDIIVETNPSRQKEEEEHTNVQKISVESHDASLSKTDDESHILPDSITEESPEYREALVDDEIESIDKLLEEERYCDAMRECKKLHEIHPHNEQITSRMEDTRKRLSNEKDSLANIYNVFLSKINKRRNEYFKNN